MACILLYFFEVIRKQLFSAETLLLVQKKNKPVTLFYYAES